MSRAFKKNAGFLALKLLKRFVGRLIGKLRSKVLFPSWPTIHFYPNIQQCPECAESLHVQKTVAKTVVTMDIGAFWAKSTVMHCPRHREMIFGSDRLERLVPKGGTFGFDVIVEVGFSLFVHCRGNRETMAELAAKNVFVSEREIGYLGRKFIIYLALAHRRCQPSLKKFLSERGGYILHVDGTCEGDSPNLFCGLDGLTALVLETVKISSEKKELLVPFFRDIKNHYGEPRALVHDMGKGIVNAAEEVFPGVPDFICHFHFLRDIGKDLLLDDETAFKKRLRGLNVRPKLRRRAKYLESKIDPDGHDLGSIIESVQSGNCQASDFKRMPAIVAYALLQWIFDAPSQSGGYGFPFDRANLDFYRRLQTVHRLMAQIKTVDPDLSAKAKKPFLQTYKVLTEFAEDNRLNDLSDRLEAKAKIFDKLRKAMRIALPEGKNGINDNGDATDMRTVEEKVTAFRLWLVGNKHRKKTYANMVSQIDKYWKKLFADPITVVTPGGEFVIHPQRTNNILERFFRDEKRRGRKKTGTATLNKVLKSILADTPLVRNLKNDDYMKIILDGCSGLEERFSQIEARLVQEEMTNVKNINGKMPPGIKKAIRDTRFIQKILVLLCPSEAK